MSFELLYLKDRTIATFRSDVKENEIKNAFIEIVDNISIKKIDFLIFDFTNITSYTIPKDPIETLKTITLFSATWNTDIKVAVIASNSNVRTVIKEVIKRQEEFNWEFNLFEEFQTGINWCEDLKFV